MGQPITVVEKHSSNPAVMRFETNRPLSGMAHERYTEAPPEILGRPVDELARRLLGTGDVDSVHINGSVVTVTLKGGRNGAGLGDIVRQLFRHYPDLPATMTPPTDEGDRTPMAVEDTGTLPAAQHASPPAASEPGDEPAPDSGAPEGEAAE
jgi:hypothetical protein